MSVPYMGDYYSASGIPRITKDYCRQYLDQPVHITMKDNTQIQAIIIDVDDHNVTVLALNTMEEKSLTMNRDEDERFFGYGFRPGFWGFRRLIFPLAAISALSLLPFAAYPYYPYYPPYPSFY